MKAQKQLIRHRPNEGLYGDCFRTAIAAALDLDAADVPHFMDGTVGKGEAPKAHDDAEAWLNERGLTQINMLFPGDLSADAVICSVKLCNPHSPGIVFMLGGESRSGVNHVVLCCDGEIACDPSQTDSGIIGPCDDGYYWVTFFGAFSTSVRPSGGEVRCPTTNLNGSSAASRSADVDIATSSDTVNGAAARTSD